MMYAHVVVKISTPTSKGCYLLFSRDGLAEELIGVTEVGSLGARTRSTHTHTISPAPTVRARVEFERATLHAGRVTNSAMLSL